MRIRNGLDIASRQRIVEHVRANPGLHLRALADGLGMHQSTLAYHCRILARLGHIAVREGCGRKAYYPAEGLDRRDRDLLHVVVRPTPRTICLHLLQHPGSTPGDLKRALCASGSFVTFHLNRLREANVLLERPAGRTKRLYVEDAPRMASLLATRVHPAPDPTVLLEDKGPVPACAVASASDPEAFAQPA
jgi:predicted transcriptional regulator